MRPRSRGRHQCSVGPSGTTALAHLGVRGWLCTQAWGRGPHGQSASGSHARPEHHPSDALCKGSVTSPAARVGPVVWVFRLRAIPRFSPTPAGCPEVSAALALACWRVPGSPTLPSPGLQFGGSHDRLLSSIICWWLMGPRKALTGWPVCYGAPGAGGGQRRAGTAGKGHHLRALPAGFDEAASHRPGRVNRWPPAVRRVLGGPALGLKAPTC